MTPGQFDELMSSNDTEALVMLRKGDTTVPNFQERGQFYCSSVDKLRNSMATFQD